MATTMKAKDRIKKKTTVHTSYFNLYPCSNGFTLIEVLIGLVLLTIVLGAVYSSFFTVQKAFERFDGISLKFHEARTVLDLMRRETEGAFLNNSRSADSEDDTNVFVIEDRDSYGNSTSKLRLTAFSFKGNGIKSVSYYVKEIDKNLVLVKKESTPFKLSAQKNRDKSFPDSGYTYDMMEKIESFTAEALVNNKWIKTWDTRQTGTIPEVIRFSIEFYDKGDKVKLTEYARPKIGRQF